MDVQVVYFPAPGPAATGSGPTLDSVSISDAGSGNGTLTVTFDAGETNGRAVNVRGYIDTPADADPDAATAWAGTGANATFAVATTIGATGVAVSISGAVDALQDVFVVAEYNDTPGSYSNVVSQTGVDFDTIAPVLTSPTGAANGATGATTLGVDTDETGGTVTLGIYPSASTPSAEDVEAGTGATLTDTLTPASTGTQSFPDATGLTASTAYKPHYVHRDANGNLSARSEGAEFTTGAVSGGIAQVGSTQGTVVAAEGANAEATVNFTETFLQDDIVHILIGSDAQVVEGTTGSGGNNPTFRDDAGWTQRLLGGSNNPGYALYSKVMGSTPDTGFNLFASAGKPTPIIIFGHRGVDTATPYRTAPAVSSVVNGSTVTPPSLGSLTDGDLAIIGAILDDDNEFITAPSGYANATTQEGGAGVNDSSSVGYADKAITATGTETPGAITWSGADETVAFSLALRPA